MAGRQLLVVEPHDHRGAPRDSDDPAYTIASARPYDGFNALAGKLKRGEPLGETPVSSRHVPARYR